MRRKKVKIIVTGIASVILGVFLALQVVDQPGDRTINLSRLTSSEIYVKQVYDGDTIEISQGLQKHKIRLIGIDTPEVVDPRKPVQCYGQEASAKTKSLLPVGSTIKLEFDDTQGESDKFGRLLAYVYLSNGQMLNQILVKEGFAHEYTYQNNPYKYQKQFIAAQLEAETNNRGLWDPQTCGGNTK